MHLLLDGEARNIKIMTTPKLMRPFLEEVVKLAGMTPYGKAYCQGFPWPGSKDTKALTAFQPLKESGMSVHCYPEREYVFIDLFSCSKFGTDLVIGHIVRRLQMGKIKVIILERGVEDDRILPASLISNRDYDYWVG